MKKLTTIFLILFLTTSAFGQYFAPNQKPPLGLKVNGGHTLSKGLVGCWLLNEVSGGQIYDLSGNNFTGTIGSATTWVPEGLKFIDDNANNGVVFGNMPASFESGHISVVAKVYIRAHTDTWAKIAVSCWDALGTWADPYSRWNIGRYSNENNIVFSVTDSTNTNFNCIGTNGLFTAGGTFTVAGTYDGSIMRLYVDGVQIQTNINPTGNIPVRNKPFIMGREGRTIHTEDWDGNIYWIYIYNRALSASEIALLYSKPFCFMGPNWNWNFYVPFLAAPAAGAPQVIFIN